MSLMLKLRRGETPFYRALHNAVRRFYSSTLPLPKFLRPALGLAFSLQQSVRDTSAMLFTYFIREPLFRGRCCEVGKNFHLERMPYVASHAKIYIGDDVNFFGKVDIFSGRLFDEPKVIIGNRVDLGHNITFIVNKEILLEDDINVASGVHFMDTDSHPRDTAARIADLPPQPDEVKPIRVRRYAWIGHNAFIMKGVTIGEGAIIGVNSVVVTDIPAYCVAMGNPAKVVMKNLNQAAPAAASSAP